MDIKILKGKNFVSWIIINNKTKKTMLGNAFEDNMSTDIKFFKTQIFK